MEISSEEELRVVKDVAVVIDVRPPDEIVKSNIKVDGSLNVVLGPDFVAQVEAQVDKEAVIICHCQRGMRAENAKRALIEAGYTRVLNGENAQRINDAFAG